MRTPHLQMQSWEQATDISSLLVAVPVPDAILLALIDHRLNFSYTPFCYVIVYAQRTLVV